MFNENMQGDELGTYVVLVRTGSRNMGWPTAREGQGHGAWVVVVGVTPHQGHRESR